MTFDKILTNDNQVNACVINSSVDNIGLFTEQYTDVLIFNCNILDDDTHTYNYSIIRYHNNDKAILYYGVDTANIFNIYDDIISRANVDFILLNERLPILTQSFFEFVKLVTYNTLFKIDCEFCGEVQPHFDVIINGNTSLTAFDCANCIHNGFADICDCEYINEFDMNINRYQSIHDEISSIKKIR